MSQAGVIIGVIQNIRLAVDVVEPLLLGGKACRLDGVFLVAAPALALVMGQLDEKFAVAFNDVDFCVRVRQAGYTNVFTPFAQLYHYESKSRGMEDNPEKQKRFQGEVLRFQARWGDLLAAGDPCTNPNFDIQREDFSLKILPLE